MEVQLRVTLRVRTYHLKQFEAYLVKVIRPSNVELIFIVYTFYTSYMYIAIWHKPTWILSGIKWSDRAPSALGF